MANKTISLYRKIQKLTAEHLGCGGCTVMADWATSTVQFPESCKLNESFLYCPMTGMQPRNGETLRKKTLYLFVETDEEGSDAEWRRSGSDSCSE